MSISTIHRTDQTCMSEFPQASWQYRMAWAESSRSIVSESFDNVHDYPLPLSEWKASACTHTSPAPNRPCLLRHTSEVKAHCASQRPGRVGQKKAMAEKELGCERRARAGTTCRTDVPALESTPATPNRAMRPTIRKPTVSL